MVRQKDLKRVGLFFFLFIYFFSFSTLMCKFVVSTHVIVQILRSFETIYPSYKWDWKVLIKNGRYLKIHNKIISWSAMILMEYEIFGHNMEKKKYFLGKIRWKSNAKRKKKNTPRPILILYFILIVIPS
jgi:hypothetical protein